MFDDLVHGFRIWRLQSKKEDIWKSGRKERDDARAKNKTRDEIEEIIAFEGFEIEIVDDAILDRQSQYLGNLADKYLIPRPKFVTSGGVWEQSGISGRWRLNQDALVDLRGTIRGEQKERRGRVQSWLIALTGIIGAVTGLIGVLIGLISIWPNSN